MEVHHSPFALRTASIRRGMDSTVSKEFRKDAVVKLAGSPLGDGPVRLAPTTILCSKAHLPKMSQFSHSF